jgi:hypothetical protein
MSLTAGGMPASMLLQTKAADPKPRGKLVLGEDDLKQLLLLMDTEERQDLTARVDGVCESGVRQTGY